MDLLSLFALKAVEGGAGRVWQVRTDCLQAPSVLAVLPPLSAEPFSALPPVA